MTHKRTLVIPLDDAGKPLGAELIEESEQAAEDTVNEASENAESNTPEQSAAILQEAIDNVENPATVESETEEVAETIPTQAIDESANAAEVSTVPESSVETITPIEPPAKPPAKTRKRHRFGR